MILGAVWLLTAGALGWGFALREEKLSALCELDGPTGMFNRRHFEVCFKRSLAQFVVLAPQTNIKQAEAVARRISAAVRTQAAVNSARAGVEGQPSAPWVTVSVGYAIADPDKVSSLLASTLFAEADQAMYRRKASRAATTCPLPIQLGQAGRQQRPGIKERS